MFDRAAEPAGDSVRRFSEELARDPGSRVFLRLGDALRRQGELDVALRVALRGLERHPYDADAHDLLARIAVDRGEWQRAADEWDVALQLAPQHQGALKGAGFLHFRAGRLVEAERLLRSVGEDDPAAVAALAHVRAQLASGERPRTTTPSPGPATQTAAAATQHGQQLHPYAERAPRAASDGAATPPSPAGARALFADTLAGAGEGALLLDADGFVIAGRYAANAGRDVGDDVGAQLSGVSDEATRAMRHLGLGAWTALTLETEDAVVTMAPAPHGTLLLVVAGASAPLGYVRLLVARAVARAEQWLGVGA